MDHQEFNNQLEKTVLPILEQEGIQLIELKVQRWPGNSLVRLLVDKKEGGITIQECARLNEKIGNLLNSCNIIDDRYVLEVSSPGLDRPLKSRDDFQRCLNSRIRILLSEAVNGKMEWDGLLKRVTEDTLEMEIGGQNIMIELAKIILAKRVIEIS